MTLIYLGDIKCTCSIYKIDDCTLVISIEAMIHILQYHVLYLYSGSSWKGQCGGREGNSGCYEDNYKPKLQSMEGKRCNYMEGTKA